MTLTDAKHALRKFARKEKVAVYRNFFKTGKGEYGEGDRFLGVNVPNTRIVAKRFSGLRLKEVEQLLCSPFHEERLLASLMLVEQYRKRPEKIVEFYLKNSKRFNNWDLVDSSAPQILGDWLLGKKNRSTLDRLAVSDSLWERRISIVATYSFIRHGQYSDTLRISTMLLRDKHDLIHKAVGWMLREVWKKDAKVAEQFLGKHAKQMPRTALRYATERMPVRIRQKYLR